jgi:hypothetical protein
LFMGVTNSDNNGRRINIKLEIFKNGTAAANKLTEGTLANVQVAGNAMNNATKFTVPISPMGNVEFAENDILYAKISVQRVGGSGNFGVRFWYNDDSVNSSSRAWSRIAKGTTGSYYYFLTCSSLRTAPNDCGIANVLTATTSYQSFGTWSIQGSLLKPGSASNGSPSTYALEQNFPNPFNPTTQIRYGLPMQSNVKLTIHNVLGQEVARIVDEDQDAGFYEVQWEGKNQEGTAVASGVYFYRIQAGNFVKISKMLFLK